MPDPDLDPDTPGYLPGALLLGIAGALLALAWSWP